MATEIESLLEYTLNVGANELILTEGGASAVRLSGKVCAIPDAPAIPVGSLRSFLPSMDAESGTIKGNWCGSHWRVRYYRAALGNAAVFRPTLAECPEFSSLGAPESLSNLLGFNSGLVVFAGPPCSGKTTTATAYVSEMCKSGILRVSSLDTASEIPINFAQSLVLNDSSKDIPKKIEQALRSGTDLMWLGDFDSSTLVPILQAAESSTLVVITVTAGNVVGVLDALLSSVPSENRALVRGMLASVLKAVIVQRLVPSIQGGCVAAWEILYGTQNVASQIRNGEYFTLPSIIGASSSDGMMLMDDCLLQLANGGYVSVEDASRAAVNPTRFG
ncbi:MAG: Flp pilus assembly complex ATPase component TadA [Fibrobacter sp.]|nr:Flp pilus assembly complex ATPase component TadA [Fibrobacter sp.]